MGIVKDDPIIVRHLDLTRRATFTLVTSESWKDKVTGKIRIKNQYHTIVVDDEPLIQLVERAIHQNSYIYVEATLSQEEQRYASGIPFYNTIITCGNKSDIVLLNKSQNNKHLNN